MPCEFDDFLTMARWGGGDVSPLAADASSRQYFRIKRAGQTAILMLAPPGGAPSAYAQQAKLANNDCGAFVCLARELSNRGFAAPDILATDLPAGLVLLEDLGNDLFFNVLLKNPQMEHDLYQSAVSTLAALCRSSFDPEARYHEKTWPIRKYDIPALLAETELFSQYYLPEQSITLDQSALQGAWQSVLDEVGSAPTVLVLRDFHAQNLLYLPARPGVSNIGLLDFQDAVFGHRAYDLVSLLQDARRDVTPALEMPMLTYFIKMAKISASDQFIRHYRILGAQRAAKILGIFVRLAKRDGKGQYLALLPRVEAHFAANLADPALAPVADVLRPHLPNLCTGGAI